MADHGQIHINPWLEEAIDVAKSNDIRHLPRLGAVLVTRDGHVHYGQNKYKTHPLQARFGRNEDSIYLHAEVDAIVQAMRLGSPTDGASLYVARVLRDGTVALAKPCIGCQRALIHFDIANVEWTI